MEINRQSIASGGTADLDVSAGVLRVETTSAQAGQANIQSLALGTVLDAASVTGVLTLTSGTGDLRLRGVVMAQSFAADLTSGTGSFVQETGSLSVTGNAQILTRGAVVLSDMAVTSGSVTIRAEGRVTDTVTDRAALRMAGGSLTIDALAVGGVADGDAFDVNVARIASISTANTDASARSVNVVSHGKLDLGAMTVTGTARLIQRTDDLTLSGNISVSALQLAVQDGNLSQAANARLTVAGDIAIAARDLRALGAGNIALASVTSLNGSILLEADGAITDATGDRETEILRTSAASGSVSLRAGSIGTAASGGGVEVFSANVKEITTTRGDANLSLLRGGTVEGGSVAGAARIAAQAGDLLLTGVLSAQSADIAAQAGSLTQQGAARLVTTGAVRLSALNDMRLTEVQALGGNADTAVTLQAGGAILDNLTLEPTGLTGRNVVTDGQITITARTLGTATNRLDLAMARLTQATLGGDAYVTAFAQGGTLDLGKVTDSAGVFDLRLDAGDLRQTADVEAARIALAVVQGGLVQDDGTRAYAYGDLSVRTTADMVLSRLVTDRGAITLDAGTDGRVLDGTVLEAANIVGNTSAATLSLSGRAVGVYAPDAEGNPGDLDVSIGRITSIYGGRDGVYLDGLQALELGRIGITGALEVRVQSGDLTLSGEQSAARAKLLVTGGALVQRDGVTLTTSGVNGQAQTGNLQIETNGAVTLSRMVVQNGDASIIAANGALIDGSAAEGTGRENLSVTNGVVTRIEADSIGSVFEAGEFDIAATTLTTVTTDKGGAFIGLTGQTAAVTRVASLTTTGTVANAVVTLRAGNLDLDTTAVTGSLTATAAGTVGADSLRLGNATVGRNLTVTATAGNIVQQPATALRADWVDGVARLTAGGDIVLANAGNDLTRVQAFAGGRIALTDRDDLAVMGLQAGTRIDVATSGPLTFLTDAAVGAGGAIATTTNGGDVTLQSRVRVFAGGELTMAVTDGNFKAMGSSTLVSRGNMALDVKGDVDMGGVTTMVSDADITVKMDGRFTSTGTIIAQASAGKIAVEGVDAGQIALSGTNILLARDSVSLKTQSGDMGLSGRTTIVASQGAVLLESGGGSLATAGTTTISATDVAVRFGGQGQAVLDGTTTIVARTGAVNIDLADHDLTMRSRTVISAATDVRLAIAGNGDMGTSGQTTILAATGSVSAGLADGDMTLTGRTVVSAKQMVDLTLATGDLAASGGTTLYAGVDLRATLAQGAITLQDRSILAAVRDVIISAHGGLSASGLTDVYGAANVTIRVDTGDVSLADTSRVSNGTGSINVQIGNGDLLVRDTSAIVSYRDVIAGVDRGNVTLRDSGTVNSRTAGVDLSVGRGVVTLLDRSSVVALQGLAAITVAQGSITMQDAETLIQARDVLARVIARLDAAGAETGDIRLDRIEGTRSVRIEALDGRILDNTASEQVDLIVTAQLDMVAADGVGIPWLDNLNISASVVSILNTRSEGINIQNRRGFLVGEGGIFNRSTGPIALVSAGRIAHFTKFFATDPEPEMAGKVGGQPGSSVYLVHRASSRNFNLNLGNEKEPFFVQSYYGPMGSDGVRRQTDTQIGRGLTTSVGSVSGILGATGTVYEAGVDQRFEQWLAELRAKRGDRDAFATLKAIYLADHLIEDGQTAILGIDGVSIGESGVLEMTGVSDAVEQMRREVDLLDARTDRDVFSIDPDELIAQIDGQTPARVVVQDGAARPVIQLAMALADDDLSAPLIAAE